MFAPKVYVNKCISTPLLLVWSLSPDMPEHCAMLICLWSMGPSVLIRLKSEQIVDLMSHASTLAQSTLLCFDCKNLRNLEISLDLNDT